MKKLLFANWKMNLPAEGITPFVAAMATGSETTVEVAIAPPFPFIRELGDAIERSALSVRVGAQNCSDKPSGAFTGEVSAAMLRSLGVHYVVLGHSERRQFFGDTSAGVGQKVRRAIDDGLAPVLCVGENQETRDAGQTIELLRQQLTEAAGEIDHFPETLTIAYEPVWAIGTGRTATPEMAADAHAEIREIVRQLARSCEVRILYGGSVTPENAAALAAQEGIDGFLVGGASLTSEKFAAIRREMAPSS